MFSIAIIAFRESLEIFLILVPLVAYLKKLNKSNLAKYIYLGSSSGILTSVLLGSFLYNQTQNLPGYANNLFEGSIMLVVAVLIAFNLVLIGSKKLKVAANIEEEYKVAINVFGLFVLAFLTVFRESLEIIMFSLPMFQTGALIVATGLILGILASSAITIVIYKSSIKLNISWVFSIITLILIFVGSLMFAEGIAELLNTEDESIMLAGRLVYVIPCLYFYIKNTIKNYIKINS